jgi:hypothetical protein
VSELTCEVGVAAPATGDVPLGATRGSAVSRARMLVAVPLVVLAVLGLAGCRGADRGAVSAPPATASSADPLAGIESEVDSVERDVDSDATADADSGR